MTTVDFVYRRSQSLLLRSITFAGNRTTFAVFVRLSSLTSSPGVLVTEDGDHGRHISRRNRAA